MAMLVVQVSCNPCLEFAGGEKEVSGRRIKRFQEEEGGAGGSRGPGRRESREESREIGR